MCCPLVTIPGKVTNEDFSPLVPFFKKDTNERCRLSTVFSKKCLMILVKIRMFLHKELKRRKCLILFVINPFLHSLGLL